MKIRIILNESKNKQELYDLEKAYFGGDPRDAAESLKFLVDNNKDQYGEIDKYAIEQILMDAGETKVSYAGEGAFRITYTYGDDLVIKIAKTNTAKVMNEQDTELGRLPIYSLLFPKVYMVDEPEYNWIVMEKCEPINDPDVFIKFFPNSFYKGLPSLTAIRAFQKLLEYEVSLIKQDESNLIDIEKSLPYYKNTKFSNPPMDRDEVKQILKQFNKTFHVLAQMVAEFGVSTHEIRQYNTGIAPDGRFVVIDSSIASAISKGVMSINENNI